MSYTPFAYVENLRIGTVDFISPDEVKVLLDIDAPNRWHLIPAAYVPSHVSTDMF